jgi:hypothetical protein
VATLVGCGDDADAGWSTTTASAGATSRRKAVLGFIPSSKEISLPRGLISANDFIANLCAEATISISKNLSSRQKW